MSTYTNVTWMTVDDHDATSGDGYVTHTCETDYKGRLQREGYTTITTADDVSAVVTFIQLGLGEYVEFDSASYSATSSGGTITITGTTNASQLTFELTVDASNIGTLPTYFEITADGVTTGSQDVSGQVFSGDPGAEGEIAFEIEITIAENTSISSRYCTLTATGESTSASVNIIQAAGSSYIWIETENQSSATITFTAAGTSDGSTSVDTDVLSNDDWTITVAED